jgi:hypothetical protein
MPLPQAGTLNPIDARRVPACPAPVAGHRPAVPQDELGGILVRPDA